jgi:hypothetical protein
VSGVGAPGGAASGVRTRRLITFCLWGDDLRYTVGALKNALLAPTVYPGWTCRFYIGASTPPAVVESLRRLDHVEVVLRDEPGDWRASVWRFLPASEPDVEVMISRDTDSRLSARERAAVDEWLASDRDFHIMRDHPFHTRWAILAGMWGVRGDRLRAIRALLDERFYDQPGHYAWGVDQHFLARAVHPLVRRTALVHDELSPTLGWDAESERRPFPTPRQGHEFVGQVFDQHDRTVARHVEVLAEYLRREDSS